MTPGRGVRRLQWGHHGSTLAQVCCAVDCCEVVCSTYAIEVSYLLHGHGGGDAAGTAASATDASLVVLRAQAVLHVRQDARGRLPCE